jgi:two-component system, LuxR family, sensor kinase FixL
MSWITIAWSTVASACLTLALIHFFIWVRDRRRYAYLLFSVSALGAALTGLSELLTLHARSVAQYEWAMYWGQIPQALLAVSMVWFIRVYFQAGRRWILIAITALWTLLLLLNYSSAHTIEFRQITGLYKDATFWGERFALAVGEPNSWRYLGDVASALWWYS